MLASRFQQTWQLSGGLKGSSSSSSSSSRYMGTMYTLDAFTTSCPADQDILSHYKMQQVNTANTNTNTNLGPRAPRCPGVRSWSLPATPTLYLVARYLGYLWHGRHLTWWHLGGRISCMHLRGHISYVRSDYRNITWRFKHRLNCALTCNIW